MVTSFNMNTEQWMCILVWILTTMICGNLMWTKSEMKCRSLTDFYANILCRPCSSTAWSVRNFHTQRRAGRFTKLYCCRSTTQLPCKMATATDVDTITSKYCHPNFYSHCSSRQRSCYEYISATTILLLTTDLLMSIWATTPSAACHYVVITAFVAVLGE